MEKIIKEFYVYKFDELSEQAKEQAIEKEKQAQEELYCDTCLLDDMNYEASELLKEYFNIEDAKDNIYYDLSYSQGSGAMVEFTINIEDLNNKYHIYNDEEIRLIKDKSIVNDIKIYHNDNYYYHEYTFDINYDDDFGYYDYEDIKDDYNISEEDFNKMQDKLIDLLDTYNKHNTNSQFVKDIINMNCELKNYGEKQIEYWWKNESVLDYCKEHTYCENGDIYEW